MDEIALRKSEIEEKLKQVMMWCYHSRTFFKSHHIKDEENLARFTDSLKRSDDLTKNMVCYCQCIAVRCVKLV